MAKVLVIEYEEFIRENIADLLQIEGYEVRTSENGKKGLAVFEEWQPDVILCDVRMPEMTGA